MALNGWSKKAPISIDNSNITADLTNFTILLTAANLPTELLAATGGCKEDGGDLRFALDDAGDNLLEYDLVGLDKSAGEIVVYVKMDLLAAGTNDFYIFWGNSSAQIPAYDVWSDFYAALHLQETPVGDGFKTFRDSAGTYNALSEAGTPTSVSSMVSGHKGIQVTSGNYIVLEEEMNISGDFYFEFWVNYNGTAPTAATQNLFAPVDFFSGVGTTGIGINSGTLVVRDTTIGGSPFPDWGAWTHVAFYVDAGTMYYYVNGSLSASAAFTASIERVKWLSGAGSTQFIQFPAVGYSISGIKFTRNSPIANASDVIQTRYNNVNNIATFATAGAVETVTVQTSLTLTNLKAGSEVRIYDGLTELAGVESSTDTFTYNYSYTSDLDVEVVVHSREFKHIRIPLTLRSASSLVPIQQQRDRTYSNPT